MLCPSALELPSSIKEKKNRQHETLTRNKNTKMKIRMQSKEAQMQ